LPRLKRYWVTFERQQTPSLLNLGVGVTAYSEADACKLVAEAFDQRIVRVEVITDMRSIDQKHVIPHMGNHFERGIWFPTGFSKRGQP
jgi:hypothetical protein